MRLVSILVLLTACGDDSAPSDAGGLDAGGRDAATLDSSALDAPTSDSPLADAPPPTDGSTADGNAAPGATGSPCTSDDDCVEPNTLCLEAAAGSGWDAFPGGYCTHMGCTFGAACGTGGTCAPLPMYGPHCFVTCTGDSECRTAEGYTCQMSTFIDARLCLPPPT